MLTEQPWLPLSARGTDGRDYLEPKLGIPESLWPSLSDWITNTVTRSLGGQELVESHKLKELGRVLDLTLDWGPTINQAGGALKSLLRQCENDPVVCWNVVDYQLSRAGNVNAEQLRRYLEQARSIWRVMARNAEWVLERVVSAELYAMAFEAMAARTRPGAYLAKAWRECFGVDGKPDSAFRDAVRAVEAASILVVEPNNGQATLGSVLGTLKAQEARFELILRPPAPFNSVAAFRGTMDLLWKSQFDRHGTPDDDVDLNVSPEEAEFAVAIATALVHVLGKGGLRRKT
jgi:hypothetical protein